MVLIPVLTRVDGLLADDMLISRAKFDKIEFINVIIISPLYNFMNGDYTVAIGATIVLVVVFTIPVIWQFLQPNDDDFGDLTKRPK